MPLDKKPKTFPKACFFLAISGSTLITHITTDQHIRILQVRYDKEKLSGKFKFGI